jgi:two-component system LytT family response regulator
MDCFPANPILFTCPIFTATDLLEINIDFFGLCFPYLLLFPDSISLPAKDPFWYYFPLFYPKMKLKALIADDEEFARQTLWTMVEKFTPEVEIIGQAGDVGQLKQQIENKNPQLIFLDIAMNGEIGFEIFDRIQKRTFEVLITSAHGEYALKSFDYGIADYLLKPISPSGLKRAVERVSKILQTSEDQNLALATADGIVRISVKELVRVEAERNYSWIYLESGRRILSSKNLGYFEEALKNFGYSRIHHSHLVALNRIKAFQKTEGAVL